MKYDAEEFSEPQTLAEITFYAPECQIQKALMIEISPNHRLYYQIHEGDLANGFTFCSVEFVSGSADFKNIWNDPLIEVDRVSHGVAYFDGMRHFYIPYWYYPDLDELKVLIDKLNELMDKHCQDFK